MKKIISNKEFNSIGLCKKNESVNDLMKEAAKLGIHPGVLAMIWQKMSTITEKFLEIEGRLSVLEK